MNNEIYANGFFLVVLFNRIRTASVITVIAGIVSNPICVSVNDEFFTETVGSI